MNMARWQVFSAIALRRLPELMPQMNAIESKVQEIFSAYEVAKSKLSDHELRHLEDIKLKESSETDVIIKETAQDKEDQWNKEKSTFQYGAYDDRLTKTQYLFLKQKFGTDIKDQYLLPQAQYNDKLDENLLDTARRALKETMNINTGFKVVSKIPSSVYSFRYPKKIVDLTGFHGAKVFFLKGHLDTPDASVLEAVDENKNANIKWLTKDEAFGSIHTRYMISFSKGLLREDRIEGIPRPLQLSLSRGNKGSLEMMKQQKVGRAQC